MSSIESTTKEQEEWNIIQSQMDDLLNNNSNTCTISSIQQVKQATATLNNMSSLSQQLSNKSTSIKSKLSSQITTEQSAITSENSHLSTLLSTTQNLQNKITTLQQTNNNINKQRKELEEVTIPKYQKMANEVVNELEEVEARHLKKLPKLKNEFRYVFILFVYFVCVWCCLGGGCCGCNLDGVMCVGWLVVLVCWKHL